AAWGSIRQAAPLEGDWWPVSAGAWIADGSILLAALAGLFLWLMTGTGLVSYFFHPSRLAPVLQARAVALSYYAAAPLVFVPVAMLVTGASVLAIYLASDGNRGPDVLVTA